MNLGTFIPWALTTGAITVAVWLGIVQWQRLTRRRELEAAARADELDDTRRAVAELESRVDFAERLLQQESRKPEERR